jgi:hypothetical protein
MDSSEFEQSDLSGLPRQKRIEDIMQTILPGLDAHRKRRQMTHHLYIGLALILFFVGGYTIGESFRPLSYSEKMIVQKLIDHTAAEQKKSVAEITANLVKQLRVDKVKEIKSHQLNDALMVLGQYID